MHVLPMIESVQFSQTAAIPLAVIRRRAQRSELSTVVPAGCGTVWEFIRARKLPAGRNVAVYLSGAIDLEVGVEVAVPFESDGNVVPSSTPSGLVASMAHFGPYHQLGTAHDTVVHWCRDHGHRLAGLNWEIYGHWQNEWNRDPSLIRTDVCYLVTP